MISLVVSSLGVHYGFSCQGIGICVFGAGLMLFVSSSNLGFS